MKKTAGYFVAMVAAICCIAASFAYPNIGLYYVSNTDPTIAPGVSSPGYQFLMRTDSPSLYYKSSAASTGWTQIGLGSAAITTLVSEVSGGNEQFVFGTGYNGNLNFDGVSTVLGMVPVAGVYTLNQTLLANNLILGSGARLISAGYLIHVNGTVTGTGLISWNGNNASGAAPGAALTTVSCPGSEAGATGNLGVGAGRTALSPMMPWCSTVATAAGGTSNVAANPGGNGTACHGGAGGGIAGTAGGGNTGGYALVDAGFVFGGYSPISLMGRLWNNANVVFANVTLPAGANAGGGASGAGTGTGAGGGGGSGAGWIFISARNCGTGSWSVEAKGGDGGSCAGTNCSGGGGGGGGTIVLYCGAGTLPATANTPGNRGCARNGAGTQFCGSGGSGIGAGNVYPGGCGGVGRKVLYSVSTGWVHTADPVPTSLGC